MKFLPPNKAKTTPCISLLSIESALVINVSRLKVKSVVSIKPYYTHCVIRLFTDMFYSNWQMFEVHSGGGSYSLLLYRFVQLSNELSLKLQKVEACVHRSFRSYIHHSV